MPPYLSPGQYTSTKEIPQAPFNVPLVLLQERINIQPGFCRDQAALHSPLDPTGRYGRVLPGGEGEGEECGTGLQLAYL